MDYGDLDGAADELIDCILDLKSDFAANETPITDDSATLQRFCAKLEFLLQSEQRARSSFLSGRKDYWNYFCECLSDNKGLNDGIRFVKKLGELRTPIGYGRAFLRFALMHHRLADTLQACVMRTKITGDWYTRKSVWLQPRLYSSLINSLYDLNSVQFDLSPQGYDLDAAWPTFAKKSFNSPSSWQVSRSSSIASLNSITPDTPTLKLNMSIPETQQSSFLGDNSDVITSWTEEELAAQNQISDLQAQVDQLTLRISDQQLSTEELIKSYQVRCEELDKKSTELEITNDELKTEMQDLEYKFIAQKQQLQRENEHNKRLNERIHTLEQQNSEILSNAEKLLSEKNDNLDSKSEEFSQKEHLLTKLTDCQTRVSELTIIEHDLKADLEKTKTEFDKLRQGIQTVIENGYDDVDVLLEKLNEKIEKFSEENETLRNAEDLIKTRCVFLESENDRLILEIQTLSRKSETQNETLESLETDNQLMKNEVLKLSKELESIESVHYSKESELNKSLSSSVALNQEIRLEMEELKLELQRREGSVEREKEEYSSRIVELENELEILRANVTSTDVKEDVMETEKEVVASVETLTEAQEDDSIDEEGFEDCLDTNDGIEDGSVEVIYDERRPSVLELTESTEMLLSDQINMAVEHEAENALCRLRQELERYVQECEGLRSLLHLVTDEEADPEKVKEITSVEKSLLDKAENSVLEQRHFVMKLRQLDAEIMELKTQNRTLKQQMESETENEDQIIELSDLKTKVCVLQNTEVQLNLKLENQKEICDELTNRILELEAKLKAVGDSPEKVVPCDHEEEVTPPDHGKDIDLLRDELNHQVEQIENLRKMIEQAEKELRDREFRISSLDVTNQRLADEMRLLQDLVSTANESSQRFETQIKSFEERITIMTRSFHGLQEENQRLLAEKTRLISDYGSAKQQLAAETEHRKALEQEQDLFEKSMVAAFEEKTQILKDELKRSRLKINRLFDIIGNPDLDLETLIADDLVADEESKPPCELSSDDDDVTSGSYDVMSAGAGLVGTADVRQKSRIVKVVRAGDEAEAEHVSLAKTSKDDSRTSSDLLKEEPDCSGCRKRNEVIAKLNKKNENQVDILSELEEKLSQKCRECDKLNSEMAEIIVEKSAHLSQIAALAKDVDSLCHVNERLRTELSEKEAIIINATRTSNDSSFLNLSLPEDCSNVSRNENQENNCVKTNGDLADSENLQTESEKIESESQMNCNGTEKIESETVTNCDGYNQNESETNDNEVKDKESEDNVPNLESATKNEFYLNFPKLSSVNELRSPMTPDVDKEKRGLDGYSVEELIAEKLRLEHKLVELTLEIDRHEADYAEMEKYVTDITNRFKQNKSELEEHIQKLEEKLSTEKENYDSAFQCYASQGFDLAKLTDRMAEQEGIIQALEIELQVIRDERQMEKDRQWEELNEIKSSLTQREEECTLLNDQLKKVNGLYDEERSSLSKLKRQMTSEKSKYEEMMKQKDKELSIYIQDSVELKKKLIKLIKEKDSLWKKTDKLEYQQRVKAAETWMNDADVTHCLGCKQEFSFMLRKHHCRLCGRIFCNLCSNNWVLTTHSRSKSRVCNLCFIEREAGSPSHGPGNGEDLDEDASIQIPKIRSKTWADGHRDSLNSSIISETISPAATRSSLVSPVSSSCSFQSSASPSPENRAGSGLPGSELPQLPRNGTNGAKSRLRENDQDSEYGTPGDRSRPGEQELKVSMDGDEIVGDRDEIFHLISDDEVARSLTNSSISKSPEESLTRSMMLSAADVTSQADDVIIRSGKMFAVPVSIQTDDVYLRWQFSTEPKSILFGLTYRKSETDDEETLVSPCHCNSHRQRVTGELMAQQTGIYTLYFDNTAAKNMDKKLNYVVEVKPKTT